MISAGRNPFFSQLSVVVRDLQASHWFADARTSLRGMFVGSAVGGVGGAAIGRDMRRQFAGFLLVHHSVLEGPLEPPLDGLVTPFDESAWREICRAHLAVQFVVDVVIGELSQATENGILTRSLDPYFDIRGAELHKDARPTEGFEGLHAAAKNLGALLSSHASVGVLKELFVQIPHATPDPLAKAVNAMLAKLGNLSMEDLSALRSKNVVSRLISHLIKLRAIIDVVAQVLFESFFFDRIPRISETCVFATGQVGFGAIARWARLSIQPDQDHLLLRPRSVVYVSLSEEIDQSVPNGPYVVNEVTFKLDSTGLEAELVLGELDSWMCPCPRLC